MSSILKTTNIKHSSSSSNNLVLESDGSATATLSSTSVVPASVGSSFVLTKSVQNFAVNTTNDTSNGYIPDCFNSSYRDYMVIITGSVGTNEAHLFCRFGTNDTLNTNVSYLWHLRGHDSLSADNKYNMQGHATNYFALQNGAKADGSQDFDRFAIKLLIHNPQATNLTSWTGHLGYPRGGTAYISSYTAGIFNGNAQFTDMSFYYHGNSGTGTFNFQSYGIKTS